MIYFLHIPKTGGASVGAFLSAAAGPERVTQQMLWDDLAAADYKLPDQTRVIYGHFGGLLPIWLGYWPRTLTILRDPVARALSHVNHIRRRDDHPLHAVAAPLSILEYCRHPLLRRTVDNFQSRYLASMSIARALMPAVNPTPQPQPRGTISVRFEDALFSLDAAYGLEEEAVRTVDAMDAVGVNEAHGPSLQVFAACSAGPRQRSSPTSTPRPRDSRGWAT